MLDGYLPFCGDIESTGGQEAHHSRDPTVKGTLGGTAGTTSGAVQKPLTVDALSGSCFCREIHRGQLNFIVHQTACTCKLPINQYHENSLMSIEVLA